MDSKSGLTFLRRAGLVPTPASPTPAIEPGALLVHSIPLQAPLPLPAYQGPLLGQPEPDRGPAQHWPYPNG